MKLLYGAGLGLFLSLLGCGPGGAFEDPEDKATRLAYATVQQSMLTEAYTIQGTYTALEGTATAMPMIETQVVTMSEQKASFEATLAALQPASLPTAPAGAASDFDSESRSNLNYQDVGTSTGVRDSDGCAVDREDTFYISGPTDPTRIYFTMRALNVRAGTVYQTRWYRLEDLRYESVTWTPDRDFDEICIYFWLQSSYTPYEGGFWSAELIANGTSVVRTRFALCEPGTLC